MRSYSNGSSEGGQVVTPHRAHVICRAFFSIHGVIEQPSQAYVSTSTEGTFLWGLLDTVTVDHRWACHLLHIVRVFAVLRLLLVLVELLLSRWPHVIEAVTVVVHGVGAMSYLRLPTHLSG